MTPKNNPGNYRNKNVKKCRGANINRQGLKHPDFHKPRPAPKSLRVSELVYKFLENVATVNDERRQRNNARTNFQRTHVRKYNRHTRRPDGPRNEDQILLQSEYQIPNDSCLETDFHNLPNSEAKETILEDCDTMEQLETKSSSQFVKEYVKAVNESKKRSERYICKALSFGVDAGFLVPTKDSEGQVFRVSSALDVEMLERNMERRKKLESINRGNRNTCYSCQSGKRQNTKSDESASCTSRKKRSKSRSVKSKRKRKKLNFEEEKKSSSRRLAKEMRGESKERKRNDKSRDESEASDSGESDVEESASGFPNVSEKAET